MLMAKNQSSLPFQSSVKTLRALKVPREERVCETLLTLHFPPARRWRQEADIMTSTETKEAGMPCPRVLGAKSRPTETTFSTPLSACGLRGDAQGAALFPHSGLGGAESKDPEVSSRPPPTEPEFLS